MASYELKGVDGGIKTSTKATGVDSPNGDLVQRHESLEKANTYRSNDENVIARFGKKQVLKRRFKSLSSIGLICGLMLTWIGVLFSLQYGLANGGTGGMIYGFMAAWGGGLIQALIMAEMASMIPLAGGAFNWVAILSPPWCKKYLSYLAGWMTIISYQAFVSAVCYTCASIIQGLIILNYPSYVPQLWHATLLFYAVIGWAVFVNTYLGRLLPRMESLVLILYIICFFGCLVPLCYLPPHRSAAEVFGTFQNLGDWDTMALAFFVGWWPSLSAFVGSDGSDHMAEEIHDAPKVVPFSIWSSFIFNGALGFAMLVAVLFCIQDVEAATESETGFPIIDIFVNVLGSVKGGSAMTISLVVVDVASTTSCVATASRVLWAFARENGLPGSAFLVKVHPETRLPINAIMVTMVINCLLALLSVGSLAAYNAFYSVVLASYYTSYLIAASVMLYKRLTTPYSDIPWGPFQLGRFGTPMTIFSIAYTFVAMFFSFWPSTSVVNAASMNYSIVIYAGAFAFSTAFWFLHGRRVYKGPIWEFEDRDRN